MADVPPGELALPRAGIVGPILGWELTTLARRARYFLVRVAYAALLGAVMWMTYQSCFQWNFLSQTVLQRAAAFASGFYFAFIGVQLFVSLLLTPAFIATSIPQEKERKTIEYLFVSDLRNREIILGKYFARVTNLLMILLVGVPIVALAGLFGGIDYLGLLANTIGTIVVMLSVAGLAMAVSIYCSTTRQALFNTYGILIFLSTIAGPLVLVAVSAIGEALSTIDPTWGWTFSTMPPFLETGLAIASLAHPASPIFLSSRAAMGFPSIASAGEMSILHAAIHLTLAAIFVIWATLRLRSAYRFEPARNTKIAKNARKFAERFSWGRPAVWEDSPHIWKEVYAIKLKRFGWLLSIFFVIGVLYYYATFLSEWWGVISRSWSTSNETLGIMASVCSVAWMGLGYLMVAFRSASSIGEEKDRDCWISLLSTPITAREMIVSKVIGSFLTITPYVLVQLPILLYCAATMDRGFFRLGYWLLSVIVFGMAVASLGVYQSLVQSSTGRAIGMTLFIAALFSGLGQIFLILPMMAAPELAKLVAASLPWTPLVMSFIEDGSSETVEIVAMSIVFMVVISFAASVLVSSAIDRFPKVSERIER